VANGRTWPDTNSKVTPFLFTLPILTQHLLHTTHSAGARRNGKVLWRLGVLVRKCEMNTWRHSVAHSHTHVLGGGDTQDSYPGGQQSSLPPVPSRPTPILDLSKTIPLLIWHRWTMERKHSERPKTPYFVIFNLSQSVACEKNNETQAKFKLPSLLSPQWKLEGDRQSSYLLDLPICRAKNYRADS
jgi:hypothetical protein